MLKRIEIYIFIFCTIFYCSVGNSQSPYVFRYLSKKDGLSQTSIFAIAQDKSGFLWFGTRDGLNKYDGYHFTEYKNSASEKSIISNDVRTIYSDDATNDLWVGTVDGLSLFHSEANNFENFKHNDQATSLTSSEIHVIFKDGKNRLWVGTAAGLNLFDPINRTFKRYFYSELPTQAFHDVSVECVLEDSKGKVWVGTSKGLYYLEEGKLENFVHAGGDGDQADFLNEHIKAVLEDSLGNFWIGNVESGLNYWDKATNKISHFQNEKNKPNSLSNNNVKAMALDTKGQLWVGTFDGLNIFNPNSKSFIVYKKTDNKRIGLSDSSIKSIFKDKRGTMWVGTYYGGVNHTDVNYQRFQNFVYGPYNNELSADVVSSFVEDENNNLWIGTEGGGLNYYNKKNRQFTNYKHLANAANTISGNNVKQLLLDGDDLWIGTFNKGINVFNTIQKTFKYFKEEPGNPNTISNNNVYGLYKENERIWILTYGGGLDIYNKKTKGFLHYKNDEKNPLSLSSDLGRVFLQTKNKDLWIGTEKGINLVIRGKDGLPTAFKTFLTNEKIYTLQEDHQQNLWIGTISNGLYKFDPRTNELLHFTMESGLPGNTVFGILEDNNKNLWLSTNFGLSKFDPQSKIFTNYNNGSGLENTEYNFNAYYKTSSGEMLFGGINGFTMFYPDDIKTNQFIPSIAFTSLKQNNKFINAGDDTKILLKEINKSSSITFKYNEANFSIGFAALDFFSPKNNHYAYKLEGLDRDWVYTIGETEANYTLQNYGNYLFRIKGGNSDGVWNPEERTIEIIVLPPPWRSWWAYCLYVLVFMVSAYIIYRYIVLQHKLQLQNIARLQQEEMHEVKLRFFTNITHELRTPLTLILGPIKELINKNHLQEEKNKLLMIDKNAERLLNLVNQILVFRKMATDHEPMHLVKGNVVPFLHGLFTTFETRALAKNIQYTFHAEEEEIYLWYDEEKIEKVFSNLVANAFKFTPEGGQIDIVLELKDKTLNIKVKDTGEGIEKSLHQQIFKRFYEKESPSHSEIKGTGIGLAISKQLIELHHGEILVDSEPGVGSTFTVILLLGNSHFTAEELLFLSDDYSNIVDLAKTKPVSETNTFDEAYADEPEHHILAQTSKHPVILIIEDNPEVLNYLKEIFNEDYEVFGAENGKKGIQAIKTHNPDLIISDVMMPEMDGISFAKQVKTNIETSHVPIILLTARTASVHKIEGLSIGADDYITKPFDPQELRLKVRNIILARKEFKEKFARVLTMDLKSIDITSADESFLALAMELIEKNIENNDYSVDRFAYDLSVSRPLLFTKLKALTDQTPNNFIKTIRLKRAAQLLKLQKLNVSEVAYKVGFQDPKYFRKCFQAQFDTSPSDYAKSEETSVS